MILVFEIVADSRNSKMTHIKKFLKSDLPVLEQGVNQCQEV